MKTIAISGKGGTGKSTIAALIIRWLSDNRGHSILAVDADSNVNLNDLLGVPIEETVGSIREELKNNKQSLPGGMTKAQFLEYKIQNGVVETPRFDLLAMGRPEGPGCYCYANNLLRDILLTLSTNYQHIVIDNEAGMEHLSRRTTQKIDLFLTVSEPTVRGVKTAGRISRLLKELDTRIGQKCLILNRVGQEIPAAVAKTIDIENLQRCLFIPEDLDVYEADQRGESIWTLPETSPAYTAVDKWMKSIFKLTDKGQ
jgi:CO dehydrogenase maturation factor